MEAQGIPHRLTGARLLRSIGSLATSEVGARARWMFAGLLAFLFAINGMNAANSYVGRDFMTAIADRDRAELLRQAFFYLAVFAIATLLSVFSHYTEERLALLWREFLTRRSIESYLCNGSYYRLEAARTLGNPDGRITEDVRSFTVTTLSFVLVLLNSGFTVAAFSGVLWSISPQLFLVAVLYAIGGSLMTILLGRPLIRFNYDQLDREANLRSGLVHVRENAEEILLAGVEPWIGEGLLDRPGTALGPERIGGALDRFSAASIGYVQLGGAEGPARCYESVLQIHGDGGWSWLKDRSLQVAKNHRQSND